MKRMCVIGSLNVDIFFGVPNFPGPGVNVVAKSFDIFTGGGKGANQAFALGRLGADVLMVGKLGDGFYGPEYFEVMKGNNVDCRGIALEPGTVPGIGLVAVDEGGENAIIYYPGANDRVDIPYIEGLWPIIGERDIFLFQLEIPLETNMYAMKRLHDAGKTVIFDPAPAQPFPDELYGYVDYVTPNESELAAISGVPVNGTEFRKAAGVLLDKGAKGVICKAGRHGAFIVDADTCTHVPPYPVKCIDPTAAGDSFNAGLAYGLAQGMDLVGSVRFANAVAGLATTAMGAQSAMPTLEQVNLFLKANE